MQVERVDFVSFLTQDIPRAKQFYSEVLGFEIETEAEALMLHRRYARFEDGRQP